MGLAEGLGPLTPSDLPLLLSQDCVLCGMVPHNEQGSKTLVTFTPMGLLL